MPSDKRSVELHEALIWACEDCGRENLVRVSVREVPSPVTLGLGDVGLIEFVGREEGSGDDDGSEMTGETTVRRYPLAVECKDCGSRYAATIPHMGLGG
jgi:hypothetical protein